MKRFTWLSICLMLIVGSSLFFLRLDLSQAQFFDDPLTAIAAETAPIIDGMADDATWDQATPLLSEVAEGKIGKVDVTLRAAYDADNVYFLLEWSDETESREDPEAGDRLALMWQITPINGFDIVGCNQACHSGFPSGMWLEDESERADLWLWQASNPEASGHMDDRYIGLSDGEDWRFVDSGDFANGSRANITAVGVWADGMWTLEISRPLDTGENANGNDGAPVDVLFVPGEPYFFGLAVMDDTMSDHSVADFSLGFIMEGGDGAVAGDEEAATEDAEPVESTTLEASIVEKDAHSDAVFAHYVTDAPVLDGVYDDTMWETTDLSRISVSHGPDHRINVTMQAVYDDSNIYMVFQWADETEDVNRRGWVYQDDSWQSSDREDRLAILWQITGIAEFETLGCGAACHSGEPPTGMWLDNPGEYGDLWNWKASRTNPVGFVDDGWMGRYSGHDDGGRYSDPGTSAYARNINEAGDAPGFIWTDPNSASGILLNTNSVPISDSMTFAEEDALPGYILREPDDSRADIHAVGVWVDGKWTLEISRALDTGDHSLLSGTDVPIDITFLPGATYLFSIVAMDNTDVDHAEKDEEIGITFTLVVKE